MVWNRRQCKLLIKEARDAEMGLKQIHKSWHGGK